MDLKWENLNAGERSVAFIHHAAVTHGRKDEADHWKDLLHDFARKNGHKRCIICGEEFKEG